MRNSPAHAPILHFRGDHAFLSNFHIIDRDRSPITAVFRRDNLVIAVPTVEHAYQAAKAQDSVDFSRVARSSTPSMAKALGRRIELRADWEAVKLDVMYRALEKKFMHPIMRRLLLDTGDRWLEERNSWGDRYWGRDEDGRGENHLGRLLMGLRSSLAGLT